MISSVQKITADTLVTARFFLGIRIVENGGSAVIVRKGSATGPEIVKFAVADEPAEFLPTFPIATDDAAVPSTSSFHVDVGATSPEVYVYYSV